ncbi:MAG: hypothetical protein KJ906_00910 [Nanoarchaeota archaeon]|nr:hypothetical protein [Nanoarchaeota archaeon]
MGSKIKFIIPAFVLIFCLISFSGFATDLTVIPNSLSIDQTNLTGMNEPRTVSFMIHNPLGGMADIYNVTHSFTLNHTINTTSQYMEFTHELDNTTDILAESNQTFEIEIAVDGTKASTLGTYSGWIRFNDNSALYEIPISVNLVDTVNMTVLNARDEAYSDVVQSESVLKINVTPSYWNEDNELISDLDDTNFTVSILHINNSVLRNDNDSASLNVISVIEYADYYELTTEALPDILLGGNYSVNVSLAHPTFTGLDTSYNEFAIDQTTLKIIVDSCEGGSLYNRNSIVCKFSVVNYGYKASSIITMNFTPESCLSVSEISVNVSDSIDSFEMYSNSTTVTGAVDGTCNLNISGYSSDATDRWDKQSTDRSFTISTYVAPVVTPPPIVIITGSPGGGDNENLGLSRKLELTSPDTFTIEQGKSTTKTIEVKNSGAFQEYGVKISISGIPSSFGI